MRNIPSVDLNDFISDDVDRKKSFVKKIGKAYNEIGFVALKGHFLNNEDVKEVYRSIKEFF
mgnify:FL=1